MKIRCATRERGYMLLSMMVLVTLMLIGLSVELPRIAQEIKREKEEELIHRGNEYKSAIRKYFRKFGQYPVSIDQLENSNNMRFLRKRYKDPFTGKDDWKLLHPGEVQVNAANGGTVTTGQPGQLGQPGQQAGGIGAPSAIGQPMGGTFGQSPGFGPASPAPGQSPGFSLSTPTASPTPAAQAGTDQSASGTGSATNPSGITAAGNMPGVSSDSPLIGGGPFVGVSSISKKKSIKVINGKDHYNDWQFVYDPRLDVSSMAPVGSAVNGANPIGGSSAPGFGNPGIGQPSNNPMNNPSTPINNGTSPTSPSPTSPSQPPPSNPTGPGQ